MFSTINSGISSAAQALSVSANNLANSNTVGFKHSTVNFADIFANDPAANQKTAVGVGVQTASVDRQMSQGALLSTGRITDLAIAGVGFFTLGSAESLIQPPPYVPISNFTGIGLPTASWPSLPQPPVYPPIGPIKGFGLQTAPWITNSPPEPFTPFSGVGLPSTGIKSTHVGLPTGSYSLSVSRANDQLDLIVDGDIKKSYLWSEFNYSNWKIGNLGPTKTYDFSSDLNDEGSQVDITVRNGGMNWYEYTYSVLKNGNVIYSTNYELNQPQPGTLTNEHSFDSDVYIDPSNPTVQTNEAAWNGTTLSGSAKNVFSRKAGIGTSPDDGFSGRENYISFGGQGSDGERYFTMSNLDLTQRKSLTFDYVSGSRSNGGDTPGPGEHLEILYSLDNGSTYQSLWSSLSTNSIDSWTSYEVTLPAELRTNNALIKFYQPNSSGTGNDTHGLSNIGFTDLIPLDIPEPEPSEASGGEYNFQEIGIIGTASNVFRRTATSNSAGDNGGFSGISDYIIFGSSGTAGQRFFQLQNLDLTHAETLGLSIRHGNDKNGAELPDKTIENLNILYSTDGGTTFSLLRSFDGSDNALNEWNTLSLSIPDEAKSQSTIIRFEQPGSSGPEFDHWGLANINIQMASVNITEPKTNQSLVSSKIAWISEGRTGSAQNVYQGRDGTGQGNNQPFNGRDNYVSFGGDGNAGQRIFTLPTLDLRGKSSIYFDAIKGNGTNGGEASNIGENFLIEYSNDGGLTYNLLSNLSNKKNSFSTWTNEVISLPIGARKEAVTFRFRQEGSSGPQYDHWGLSNIGFTDIDYDSIKNQGRAFTRAGNFTLDKDGYLKTSNGLHVMGKDLRSGSQDLAAIKIPSELNESRITGLEINNDGVITASYTNGTVVPLFSLAIAAFANDRALKPIGFTHFSETSYSGKAQYLKPSSLGANVMSGTLEQSTTDVTSELMLMMKAQQAFSSNSRALQTYVEMASRLTDKI